VEIINLADYKNKKKAEEDLARGRTPLYVSHATGKVTGNAASKDDDFGSRLERIRTSLNKINSLMHELKQMSAEGSSNVR